MPQLEIDIVARFAAFQDALDKVARDSQKATTKVDALFSHVSKGMGAADAAAKKAQASIENLGRTSQAASGKLGDALGKINQGLGRLGVGVAFGTIVLGLKRLVESALDAADEIGKVSQRTGIATEKLSALKYAAGLAGVEFEDLTKGLQHFNKNIDSNSAGFARLGLDLKNFKSPDEALESVAQRFSQIEDGAAKTAVAIQLFGKSGAALIPLLNGGRDSLRALQAEAKKLGLIVTPEQAANAEAFNDNLRRLRGSVEGLAQALSGDLISAFGPIIEAVVRARLEFGGFQDALEAMIQTNLLTLNGSLDSTAKQIDAINERLKVLRKNRETFIGKGEQGTHLFGQDSGRLALVKDQIDLFEKELRLKTQLLQIERERAAVPVLKEVAQRAQQEADASNARYEQTHPGQKAGQVDISILDANDARARRPAVGKEKLPPLPADRSAETRARYQVEVAAAKQTAAQLQAIDDIRFALSEESIKTHYALVLSYQQTANAAEIRATKSAIAEEVKARDASADDSQKISHNAALITLEGKLEALRKDSANAGVLNARALDSANAAAIDGAKEYGIVLLENAGNVEAAAEAEGKLLAVELKRKFLTENKELVGAGALAAFNAIQKQKEAHAELTGVLRDEEIVRTRLESRQQTIANLEAQGGTDAELVAQRAQNQAVLDSLPALQQKLDLLERIANEMEPGRAKNEALAKVNLKQAQLDGAKESASGATAALRLLQDQQRKTALAFGEEALAEEAVNNQLADGAITSLSALQKLDAIRAASIDKLREQLALDKELAASGGDSIQAQEALQRIKATSLAIDHLSATSHQVADELRGVFEDGLTDPLLDFIKGTKSASDAFQAFADNVVASILRIGAQEIAQTAFKTIAKSASSDDGWLNIALKAAGLAAGASGGTGAGAGAGSAAVSPFGYYAKADGGIIGPRGEIPLHKYARGGIATRPQLALFGEGRLPEAYVPLPDGRRIPVSMKGAIPSGGGSVINNVSMIISTPNADSFRASEQQILSRLSGGISRSTSRR